MHMCTGGPNDVVLPWPRVEGRPYLSQNDRFQDVIQRPRRRINNHRSSARGMLL